MNLKNFAKASILASALIFSVESQASFLVEPHVSFNLYSSGKEGGVDYSYNGTQYGLKLGYQQLGLMFGMDYKKSAFDLKTEGNGNNTKVAMKRDELGVFAGYEFPILVRAWGGYYFHNKMKGDSQGYEYSGNTKELGVGFTGLPFLSMNFIYRMVELDEAKTNGTATKIDTSIKEYVVGVSLPLNF